MPPRALPYFVLRGSSERLKSELSSVTEEEILTFARGLLINGLILIGRFVIRRGLVLIIVLM
ncbi:outer membrane, MSP2 family domain protein [Anaplasma phagocytophilum str. ApNP]|uniref:Outer membrane, MSP2 family domain protein n=1 Tax=Anaplasma phagocytophilum str. ApNP TaxID=1359153 RepID=A0A0F3NEM1_ANAPH|nr:outer membrane, MSP2 family domain protein [Anaplasma phagocytophilum str. ApNP]